MRFNATLGKYVRVGEREMAVLPRSHRIAKIMTARCVLWAHKLRLFPPTYLIRLRLNGQSCSARLTVAAAATQKRKGQSMEPEQKPRPRRELAPIKVWVSQKERAVIQERADQTGLSLSAYLLAVGMNTPIRSVVDLAAVADLAKVNGDLGRVAGLLKFWLAEKRGQGAKPIDVEAMMTNFRVLQAQVLDLMSRIVYKRK